MEGERERTRQRITHEGRRETGNGEFNRRPMDK